MTGERVVRRLAAILAADVAGYSRLMGRDENGTLTRLRPEGALATFTPAFVRSSRNSDYGARLVEGLRLAASSQT